VAPANDEDEPMLLTITTTHTPATDLGYLLHKHPGKAQQFALPFGTARVFYPEASEARCTAALFVEVDPIGLVRGRGAGSGTLDAYVNDRAYAASSFLSVAIGSVYRSALVGSSESHATLADTPLPFSATIAALPCHGGEATVHRLFEPLGYAVHMTGHALDPAFPEWGQSRLFTVTLEGTMRLRDLLSHLYVLIPVLDGDKHYYVGTDEVAKLVRRGEGWLAAHPERNLITSRYLRHRRSLTADALAQLIAEDDSPDPDATDELPDTVQTQTQTEVATAALSDDTPGLHQQRIAAVMAILRETGARRVLDLGCGEGQLLREMIANRQFTEIVGLDASNRALERASERLHLDRLAPTEHARVTLLHGALTYRDDRLAGYDAAALVEVVEHLDSPRLPAFERVIWEFARPGTVIVTTPNREYNVRFPTLPAGHLRHKDHRFEWTRAECAAWAEGVAARYGYTVRLLPIGSEDPDVGSPSQMAVFSREAG